jgi:DNA excision repair protein ERCC-2
MEAELNSTLKIGIGELVEFCCRSGDLGSSGPSASAQDGIRAHQKIQRRYKNEAIAEQAVRLKITLDEFDIELAGRIDLLFANEVPPRVQELKTVRQFSRQPINTSQDDLFSNNDNLHWAQVKCYAACYAIENNLAQVAVSLNYIDSKDLTEQEQTEILSCSALQQFLLEVLQRFVDWQRLVTQQKLMTLNSARQLAFPFDQFRAQQREFAAHVYRSIQQSCQLLVEAPTGSGKTISTLFPAVKAIGEDLCDQIIFLSAKTSGQNEARKAIDKMIDKGLLISYLVVKAKAKSCPCANNESEFNIEGQCQRTVGFYDRLPAARNALLEQRTLDSETVGSISDQFNLCPFELSLQMLPWVDIAICDFNYVFDPLVQLSYFRSDSKRKVLLIDEMHNLVDRARSMYSASMNRGQINTAAGVKNSPIVQRSIVSIGNELDKFGREQIDEESISDAVPEHLQRAVNQFCDHVMGEVFDNRPIAAEVVDLTRAMFRFQCISELFASHHKTIVKKPLAECEVKLSCLNAFENLQQIYPLFNTVCGFSATLTPAEYFLPALGLTTDVTSLRLASSFPVGYQQVCIGSFIDTRYRQRNAYIDAICDSIASCFLSRSGNYLVFFSSYQFMQKVHQRFSENYAQIATLIQQRNTNDDERARFLSEFFEKQNTLGFVILGGIFAEGIDYIGDALIGAIIVGVGLPQASSEQQLILRDFEAQQLNGFDYAYRFPGLTRVLQSAGRVIRSDTDQGVVVLLDRRFQQDENIQHLPPHWQVAHCQHLASLQETLESFWANVGADEKLLPKQ